MLVTASAQAALWLRAVSMPSVNLMPSIALGNWFCPSSLRHDFWAAWS
jgi:hypothetical protein